VIPLGCDDSFHSLPQPSGFAFKQKCLMTSFGFSTYRFISGAAIFFAAISAIVIAVNATGILDNSSRNKEVDEACRQYSESNIAAFYYKLGLLDKISVQLSSTTLTPAERYALASQMDLLEYRMRQDVAKIPIGSRTSAMAKYSN